MTVSSRWRFWGGETAILGRRLRVAFLALCVHWGGCERSPAALPRRVECGACAGSGGRAPERRAGRLGSATGVHVGRVPYGGVSDVGTKV